MSDNRSPPYVCECGFWDRDRPHSRVGGGNCEHTYRRRTGRVDHIGDIAIPDEVVDIKLLLAERARAKRYMERIAELEEEVQRLRALLADEQKAYVPRTV